MMWIILQRELWIRLRDFRFWIGVLSLPLLIGAVLGVTVLLKREKPPISVYLVGADELAPLLASAPRFKFTPIDSAVAPQRKATLQEGETLLELTEHAPTQLVFTLYGREVLSEAEEGQLRQLLQQAIQRQRVRELGLSTEQWVYLNPQLRLQNYLLRPDSETPQSARLLALLSIAVSILIYFILSSAGFQILLSVLEEKANRLSEYLAISVPATEILTAKLLAALLLALLRGAILFLFAYGAFYWLGTQAPQLINSLGAIRVPWGWLIVYLVGGILLYAFLYAAGGASSDSTAELSGLAQVLQWVPTLVFMLIVLLWENGPNSGPLVWRILSYFPLTAPIAMPTRLLTEEVPLWENGIALVLLGASIAGARLLGARLYKQALFLYGQKFSWKDIWRALRQP